MPAQEITFDDSYMELLDAPVTPDGTEEAFDADAEYNRPAPPIPDGWYFGTVYNAGVKVKNEDGSLKDGLFPFRESKWKNDSKPYHEVAVKAQINKPEDTLVHEKYVWTGMPLRTKPDPDRGNASGISAAYKALAGEPIKGMPGPQHAKQFVELLLTEPQGWFRVQNVLRDQDAEKAAAEAGEKRPKAVYGMNKIMGLPGGKNSQGHFSGAADHPETGNRCAARAQIVEFKPRDFEPPVKKS